MISKYGSIVQSRKQNFNKHRIDSLCYCLLPKSPMAPHMLSPQVNEIMGMECWQVMSLS